MLNLFAILSNVNFFKLSSVEEISFCFSFLFNNFSFIFNVSVIVFFKFFLSIDWFESIFMKFISTYKHHQSLFNLQNDFFNKASNDVWSIYRLFKDLFNVLLICWLRSFLLFWMIKFEDKSTCFLICHADSYISLQIRIWFKFVIYIWRFWNYFRRIWLLRIVSYQLIDWFNHCFHFFYVIMCFNVINFFHVIRSVDGSKTFRKILFLKICDAFHMVSIFDIDFCLIWQWIVIFMYNLYLFVWRCIFQRWWIYKKYSILWNYWDQLYIFY